MTETDLLHFLLQCYGMKADKSLSKAQNSVGHYHSSRRHTYHKVEDKRKRPIRGLNK